MQNNARLMERHPHRLRRGQELRILPQIRDAVVVVGLALAFFLAPALQGIKLIADQSTSATALTLMADQTAATEVKQLISRR